MLIIYSFQKKKIILGDGGNSVQLKVPEHLCNNTWTTFVILWTNKAIELTLINSFII